MPIHVSVRFHRQGGYFLTGEQVSCMVTFANESQESVVENLAWSSVQLHCQEVINDHKVCIPPSKLLNSTNNDKTSFAPTKRLWHFSGKFFANLYIFLFRRPWTVFVRVETENSVL